MMIGSSLRILDNGSHAVRPEIGVPHQSGLRRFRPCLALVVAAMTVPTFATDDLPGDCGKPERFHLLPDSCHRSDPAGLQHPPSAPVPQELCPSQWANGMTTIVSGIDIAFIKAILPPHYWMMRATAKGKPQLRFGDMKQ